MDIPIDIGTTSQTQQTSDPEFVKNIDDKKRIAQLEHEIFTVCKQLDERSDKLRETQQQNALLKERVGSLEHEKLEKAQYLESLVQSRDNLIFEKTNLQNDKISIEKRKDEFELQISKLTNDKRRHLDELDQLRKQLESCQTDKIELQIQIDDYGSEKAAFAYEKEQWNREKEILLMSKQWYMNEISNREQQINELRIQAIRERADMQREITLLSEKTNELTYANEQMTASLEEREKEFAELQEKFKQVIGENTTRIGELEAELRTRERLTNVYKEASEAADKEIEELRENESRLEALLNDKEEAFQNITTELEQTKEKFANEVKEKDEEIKRLSDEVTKSTELLNAGFRLNRPGEEISLLSPAAAAASSLLKSGMSLTAIYAEHCRVVGELEKKNADLQKLEGYVKDIIQDLDAKAPKFEEQRKAYEKMTERNECLRLQNELLGKERQKLQSGTDSMLRELTFTKRELERYQREHQLLKLQNQRLLYVIEKGTEALDHAHMNGESASDQYLYSSIKDLQSKNLELAEELERLRDEQDKIIENYHNSEIEMLKQSHEQARDELNRVRENYLKQELIIRELTEQRDQYKNLYDQQASANAGMSSNASTASEFTQQNAHQLPQSLGALQAELIMWKSKAERIQETITYLNDDRQSHEKILNDRIDQQLEQISTMRNTIGKLESDVEFQNKNQQLLAKQMDSYAKDLKKSSEQLSEAKQQVETLQFKNDSLTNQLLEKQQELSTFKVQNHSLNEQYTIATSREQRLQAEVEILRNRHYNTERMSSTLQGMEALLKRVEAEKSHSSENQLQSALLERDNLRQLVESLNEQHSQLINGLKTNLNVACNERDKAQVDCKSIQSRLDAVERLYEQLKKDHETMQNEMEQIQSTDTNVEACKKEMHQMKNTIAYQEKQLAEFEQKCEELNNTIERKDKQLEEICRLGADMEGTIQFGTLERQRMQAVREQLESEVQNNKKTIEELRNSLAAKEMELLGQARLLSESNNRLDEMTGKYDQKVTEMEGNLHEATLQIERLQSENEGFKLENGNLTSKCTELSEHNLRFSTELAKEISTTERLSNEIMELKTAHATQCEKLQRSLDALEQDKLRFQDEIKEFMKRDEEHVQKHNSLYDEIQQLLKQIEFMERLQHTISSPSPNVSLNTSSLMNTTAAFSPNTSRLSLGAESSAGQQHTDRINTIIGYMRSEKQKETELRMNAELEVQRIRAQAGMDQQKIMELESQVIKLRNEAEVNANAAVEKEKLLTRLDALNEVQSRYQQLKKSYDELNQQFTQLGARTQELDQQLIKLQTEKKNLESTLESATKMAADRAQQNKTLRERYDRAMAMASKYSPEMVNSLQGENEKLKNDVTQKDRELGLHKAECARLMEEMNKLRTECTSLTEKHSTMIGDKEKTNKEFAAVKQFARKFREEKQLADKENQKLKDELKSVQDELMVVKKQLATMEAAASNTAAPTPTTSIGLGPTAQSRQLQEQVRQLTKEKEALTEQLAEKAELQSQVDKMHQELDDAAEKVMRLDMMDKALANSQQKNQTLAAEIKQVKEENQRLKEQLGQLEQQVSTLELKLWEEQNKQPKTPLETQSSHNQSPIAFDFNEEQHQQPSDVPQQPEEAKSTLAEGVQQQIGESPASPLLEQPSGGSPQFEADQQLEQSIIDELYKEDTEQPNVGDQEIGEGLLDIEEADDADAHLFQPHVEEGEMPHDVHEEHHEADEEQQQGFEFGGGNEAEEDFGDTFPDQEETAADENIYGGEEGEEFGEESDGDDGHDEMNDEEEEYPDGDEEEEEFGDEDADLDASFDAGEPPRKQRRVQGQEEGQGQTSSNINPPMDEEEDDDDDDIQCL